MLGLIGGFAGFAVLLLVFNLPLTYYARQRGATATIRRFVIAAVVIAVLCTVLTSSSTDLVSQCRDAGSRTCRDYGSTGMIAIFVGGFALVSLLNARILRNH